MMKPGSALDLTTGWDFDREHDRREAMRRIEEEDPMFIIGSPPCTMFSTLQQFQRRQREEDPVRKKRFDDRLAAAIRYVEFCCKLYMKQMSRGRYFIHEHPWSARSWKLRCVENIMKDDRVHNVRADMC